MNDDGPSRRLSRLDPEQRRRLDERLRAAAGAVSAEPVAVVGMGCRFPGGVRSAPEFWDFLVAGRDGVTEVPADRWDADEFFDPEPGVPGRMASRWGGFVDDVAGFDAEFFGIAPREAAAMDPQQRMLLEVAWEALEHGGIPPRSLAGSRTGAFVGLYYNDYLFHGLSDRAAIDAYTATGNANSTAVGRLSYVLDLRGPSVAVDTACSSSLVALHQACQALRTRECDTALAGGVSLMLSPETMISLSHWGMLSPEGRCRSFDAGANGFVRGEGCGVVVLKRLSDALSDGDRVLAVVRGSSVNQDGRSNGLTAPNAIAQRAVVETALARAGVAAGDVGLVECHGTGTALGDPIEFEALDAVYGRGADGCALGAVKSNFGHLEAAAGVAGFIKAVLCVQAGTVPPNLHFTRWNPAVDADRSRLFVPTEAGEWPAPSRPRFAGVSSFGFGGTNAHVIVEEAPPTKPPASAPRPEVTVLSVAGASPERVRDGAAALADWLDGPGRDTGLDDVAHTLTRRRDRGPVRQAVVARSREEAVEGLRAIGTGAAAPAVIDACGEVGRGLVWVFPGQGAQWAGMGRVLLDREPAFAEAVAALEPEFAKQAGFSLRTVLAAGEDVQGIDRVQPVLFGVQVALARLWQAYGVTPSAVIGHSMGEVAAAVVAGALSPEDGLRVITRRSRLLAGIAGRGAMAVLELPADEVSALLTDTPEVSVAVHAAPGQTVVAGAPDQVAALVARVEESGRLARTVKVDVASHSPQVDGLLPALADELAGLCGRTPTLPFYSTVLDDPRETPAFDAAYWAANLRRPVRFAQSVATAVADGLHGFVELSPHPILANAIHEITAGEGLDRPVVTGTLRRDEDDVLSLRTGLAALSCAGYDVNWDLLQPGGALADLPATRWRHTRHWIEPRVTHAASDGHPLLGTHTELAEPAGGHVFQAVVREDAPGWLTDHRVEGTVIMPASAYCELALAAARDAGLPDPEIRELGALAPLTVEGATDLQTTLVPDGDRGHLLRVHARPRGTGAYTVHATARLVAAPEAPADVPAPPEPAETVAPDEHYAALADRGLRYGPAFRGVRRLRRRAGTAVATVALPDRVTDADRYRIHPALLDACLQCVAAALPEASGEGRFLLAGIDGLTLPRTGERRLDVHVTAEADGDGATAAFTFRTPEGRYAGGIRRAVVRRVSESLIAPAVPPEWVHELTWTTAPHATAPALTGTWLFVADEGTAAASVAGHARRRGAEVRTLPGSEISGRSVAELRGELAGADHVVSFAALDADEDPRTALRLTMDTVRLAQALGDEAGLHIVTRGAQRVGEEKTADPAQAALWGLGRSLVLERPGAPTRLIDVDDGDLDDAAGAALAGELAADDESQVAHRDGERHVPRLVPASLPEDDRELPDGAHLVVGATGSIGHRLLAKLAGLGARHIVTVSRRGLTGAAADMAETLRGEDVAVTDVAADVADERAMAELFARFGAGLPPLRGVYQAAFAGGLVPFGELDEADMAAMFQAKVRGTALLHRLAADHEPAVFCLFSSTTGLLGSRGLAHYAAASAYLDALAHARHASGLPAHVIDWGVWRDWLDASGDRALVEGSGLRPMADERAIQALGRVLAGDRVQTVIASADWTRLAEAYASRSALPLLDGLVQEAADEGADEDVLDRFRAASPAGRRRIVVEHVRATVAHVLRMPSPGALPVRTGFFQLGMDSLMSVQVQRRLVRSTGVPLAPTALFDHSTVEELAEHITQHLSADPPDAAIAEPAAAPEEPPAEAPAGDESDEAELIRQLAERVERLS